MTEEQKLEKAKEFYKKYQDLCNEYSLELGIDSKSLEWRIVELTKEEVKE